ncbi:hypothetical protein RCL1_001179 [Eukaryota sp. TZLM3-RCL]
MLSRILPIQTSAKPSADPKSVPLGTSHAAPPENSQSKPQMIDPIWIKCISECISDDLPMFSSLLSKIRSEQGKAFKNKDNPFVNARFDDKSQLYLNNDGKIIIPDSLRPSILLNFHGLVQSGHPSLKISLERLKESDFYWPSMIPDMTRHVKSCPSCQKNCPGSQNQDPLFRNSLVRQAVQQNSRRHNRPPPKRSTRLQLRARLCRLFHSLYHPGPVDQTQRTGDRICVSMERMCNLRHSSVYPFRQWTRVRQCHFPRTLRPTRNRVFPFRPSPLPKQRPRRTTPSGYPPKSQETPDRFQRLRQLVDLHSVSSVADERNS